MSENTGEFIKGMALAVFVAAVIVVVGVGAMLENEKMKIVKGEIDCKYEYGEIVCWNPKKDKL